MPLNIELIPKRVPPGRRGAPDYVRGLAVFLASGVAAYLYGYAVAIDSGWLAC